VFVAVFFRNLDEASEHFVGAAVNVAHNRDHPLNLRGKSDLDDQ